MNIFITESLSSLHVRCSRGGNTSRDSHCCNKSSTKHYRSISIFTWVHVHQRVLEVLARQPCWQWNVLWNLWPGFPANQDSHQFISRPGFTADHNQIEPALESSDPDLEQNILNQHHTWSTFNQQLARVTLQVYSKTGVIRVIILNIDLLTNGLKYNKIDKPED